MWVGTLDVPGAREAAAAAWRRPLLIRRGRQGEVLNALALLLTEG